MTHSTHQPWLISNSGAQFLLWKLLAWEGSLSLSLFDEFLKSAKSGNTPNLTQKVTLIFSMARAAVSEGTVTAGAQGARREPSGPSPGICRSEKAAHTRQTQHLRRWPPQSRAHPCKSRRDFPSLTTCRHWGVCTPFLQKEGWDPGVQSHPPHSTTKLSFWGADKLGQAPENRLCSD